MTRMRRSKSSFQNTLKDYMVPIIGGIIIILVLVNIFSPNDSQNNSEEKNTEDSSHSLDIQFDSETTEALIQYDTNEQKQINDTINLYTKESISVKEGSLTLENPNIHIHLGKLAEFEYSAENSFSLKSSDAWIENKQKTNINMRFASIEAKENSIISFTQNEAASTIYVLAGTVKVSNLANVNTSVSAGQKISISRLDASKDDIDISSLKTEIDTFYKTSDWFLDNGGPEKLKIEDAEKQEGSLSGSTLTGTVSNGNGFSGKTFSLKNISDESSVESSQITLEGNLISPTATTISVGGVQGNVQSDKSFAISSIPLVNGGNDLIIKVYDVDKNILEKNVITIYTSSTENTSKTPAHSETANITPEQSSGHYKVNANDFTFTAPASGGTYTTTAEEISIKGLVTAEGITKVTVNGFELGSFNGSTWRYHAFKKFQTLEEGTNQYTIRYYDTNGILVYTNYYTIIKNSAE